jgi:hypothetical protein
MEIGNLPADTVSRLDVSSARIADLVIEALDEVENVLPELPVACQTLAQILAGENAEEGIDSLEQIMGIWMALRERRRQIADALGFELGSLTHGGRSLDARDADLGELLGRIQAGREKKDYAGISDLFAYDLFEFAEQEPEVFALLRAKCAD